MCILPSFLEFKENVLGPWNVTKEQHCTEHSIVIIFFLNPVQTLNVIAYGFCMPFFIEVF